MIQRLLILFVMIFLSTYANAQEFSNLNNSLIKTFTDICYMNRKQINKIPLLAEQLNWRQSNSEALSLFDINKYIYKNYTIMTRSNAEEIFCNIVVNNDNKGFGYKLAEILLEKFPPISNVTNTQEYNSEHHLLISQFKDIETNYIREWYIEGGFKIVVALTDLEYQHLGSYTKKFVSIQLSRF